MTNRNLIATIILSLIGLVIVAGFVMSQNQPSPSQIEQQLAAENQTAYKNVVKDSLNVYHSRYSHYPKDYQALLDDIAKSQSVYGVNDEGQVELKDIGGRLPGFSYTRSSDDAYTFTYQDVATGKSVTVTND